GSGFAGVADEVRKRAEHMCDSVMDVTQRVNQTNEQGRTSSSSIKEDTDHVTTVREQMKNTETAYKKIDDRMENTKKTNANMQDDLEGLDHVTNDIVQAATTISESADQLNQMLEKANKA